MKLSTRSRYGLRAIIEIAKQYGNGPSKRKDIASGQQLSESYLENILITLKNNRLVDTTRGANGGYVLSRHPKEVTVLEVVESLEGPLDLVECIGSPTLCDRNTTCLSREIWLDLTKAWRDVLSSKTLQDFVDREKRIPEADFTI